MFSGTDLVQAHSCPLDQFEWKRFRMMESWMEGAQDPEEPQRTDLSLYLYETLEREESIATSHGGLQLLIQKLQVRTNRSCSNEYSKTKACEVCSQIWFAFTVISWLVLAKNMLAQLQIPHISQILLPLVPFTITKITGDNTSYRQNTSWLIF